MTSRSNLIATTLPPRVYGDIVCMGSLQLPQFGGDSLGRRLRLTVNSLRWIELLNYPVR